MAAASKKALVEAEAEAEPARKKSAKRKKDKAKNTEAAQKDRANRKKWWAIKNRDTRDTQYTPIEASVVAQVFARLGL